MESFSFVLKTFLFTIAVVWISQIKIDNKTIEKHFLGFVHGSNLTEPIHRIADGSRKLANDGFAEVKELVSGVDTSTKTKAPTTKKASTFKWSYGSSDDNSSNVTGEDSDHEEESDQE